MIAVDVARAPLTDVLAFGPAYWDDLCERSGCISPFMSWAWHRAWADTAPPLEKHAAEVITAHDAAGAIEAMLPLRRCQLRFRRHWVRALTWAIGDIGCPDELDLPALADADVAALADGLEELPWHVIVLPNLVAGAPNIERLAAVLVERGHAARRQPLWSCPRLELPASWDDYLAALSANRRQIVRRKERSLRRAHDVAVVDYAAETLDQGWAHLLALHDRRWRGDGAFQDPRTAQLQRQFAGELASQGRLWLSTLDVDGRPAAAWYGFASGDTVYFYQGGRDPGRPRESVGLVLMGVMIRRAIERGYRAFNFLRGDDDYKYTWAPARRMTEELVVFRAGWGGRWLRLLDRVASFRAGGATGGSAA